MQRKGFGGKRSCFCYNFVSSTSAKLAEQKKPQLFFNFKVEAVESPLSLYGLGRASERGIRRSEVRLFMGTQNFFPFSHALDRTKNIFLFFFCVRCALLKRPNNGNIRDGLGEMRDGKFLSTVKK